MRSLVPIVMIATTALGVSPILGQQTTSNQTPPLRTDAAISGVVIDGVTKQPLPDAQVDLFWPQQRQFPQIQTRKLTDANGRFLFTNLPGGDNYTVNVTRYGYFAGSYGREGPDEAPGASIDLADGAWFSGATVRLWPPSSISGTVTDERGEPVVNVFVQAFAEVRRGGVAHLAASEFTTTDDRGMYRIGQLPAGRYYVVVPSGIASAPASMGVEELRGTAPAAVAAMRAAGRSPGSYNLPLVDAGSGMRIAVRGYPVPPPPAEGRAYPFAFVGGTTLSQASVVVVQTGVERTNADVQLVPVPSRRISGVLEGSPEARAGIVLRLMPAGLEDLGLGSEAASTVSNADGTFTFANVPAGSYTVDVSAGIHNYYVGTSGLRGLRPDPPPGMSGMGSISTPMSGSSTLRFVSRRATRNTWARVPITVSASDLTNIVVPLRQTLTLRGRFVADPAATLTLPGSIAGISLESATGSAWQGRVNMSQTAPAGEFLIEGLISGSYVLRLANASWRLQSVTVGGRDLTHRPIEISADAAVQDLVVTVTNLATMISGQVAGEPRALSQTVSVIAFPVEPDLWQNYGLEPARISSTRTSSAGQFRFNNLPPGNYYVIAVPVASANAWTDPAFLKRAQPVATRVAIVSGETRPVSLRVVEVR